MSPDVSSLRYRAIAGAATLAKPAAAALGISVSQIPPHHTLTSLSITHVQFSQNNFLSKLLAYVTLSPLGIICSYVAIVLTSRDLKPLVMFAGQLANEFVNQVLKRLFKQARPTEYLGDGYGMPSSHSQFMAYFATYTAILMYRRGGASDGFLPHLVSGCVVLWSALVVYSRVHLYYHTWQQVVAGSLCGIAFALGYYYIVNSVLRPQGVFDWIVNLPLAKQFYVRDTDAIPDLAKFDWEMWQQHRNADHTKQE
ncbi:PAP2 domain protein [Gamsiella multidivaricata]|uniref:PAP2 domain protein n=1 Tax=Gamsiella multidivaricata TaxID=101098 RepID=UPI002220533D|nr:PAP2 domain protein [Gamsiella multidivaricata]KAI7832746.1 PAP2 domain protein [Gamsiella multidivaricata]